MSLQSKKKPRDIGVAQENQGIEASAGEAGQPTGHRSQRASSLTTHSVIQEQETAIFNLVRWEGLREEKTDL